ncbi:MAG TPA: hypothetical protein VEU97_09730 [Ktedonobacteraceae bacterium]|nr:hypothetical protein [Ktedonobacteraceae bacterium]
MTENQKKHANGWSWDKPEKLSYLKIVGFLQLAAELLIGAEDRAFIALLAPNHHCSMSLQQILGLFDPRYLYMVLEALCLPPTYKGHPVPCLYTTHLAGEEPRYTIRLVERLLDRQICQLAVLH